jgi:hypothetical protein
MPPIPLSSHWLLPPLPRAAFPMTTTPLPGGGCGRHARIATTCALQCTGCARNPHGLNFFTPYSHCTWETNKNAALLQITTRAISYAHYGMLPLAASGVAQLAGR